MADELQRVVIVTPEPVAPADHEAKMIALVDSRSPEVLGRPEWLPAKFANVEQMAASYAALEAHLGAGTVPPQEVPVVPVVAPVVPPVVPVVPPVVAPVVAPADPLAITPDAATAAVTNAGLDMAALTAEFTAKGALSPESFAKLAAAGIPQATVDNYIAGQQAVLTAWATDVKSATPGGAEKYPEMMTWAKANLTPAEITAYNAATATNDSAQAKLAVAGLGVRFLAENGSEPPLNGGRPNAAIGDVYESIAQVTTAMKDPRYKTDVAYRTAVAAKLGRSSVM